MKDLHVEKNDSSEVLLTRWEKTCKAKRLTSESGCENQYLIGFCIAESFCLIFKQSQKDSKLDLLIDWTIIVDIIPEYILEEFLHIVLEDNSNSEIFMISENDWIDLEQIIEIINRLNGD